MKPTSHSVRIYGVLVREGKVLLANSVFFDGPEFVNFPGGGVEVGEAPGEALEREFMEETGITIERERILYASESLHASTKRPIQIVSIYWLVKQTGGTLVETGNGEDVARLFWSTPAELPIEEMFPAEREFCERLPKLLTEADLGA